MKIDAQHQLAQLWLKSAHARLDSAHALQRISGHNASIVNCAYYSMLHAVFAILTPYSFKKGPDEDVVAIALFDDKFVKSGIISKEISQKLHDAFELCQAYDFEPSLEISTEQARETVKSAVEFISIIEHNLSAGK